MKKVKVLSDFTGSNSNRTEKIINFPVNTLVTNKVADKDQEKLATGYKNKSGTIPDVMSHVKKGHALCAGLLEDGERRSKSNVVGAEWVLVDIDNTQVKKGENGKAIKEYYPFLTLEEAVNLPFISKYCALIYTSHSHTGEWHKFRLIFLLPKRIENVQDYEYLVAALMNEIPGCDPSCKDASRVFYGSTKAEFPLIQPYAELPLEWVNEKLEEARIEVLNREIEKQARLEKAAKYSNDDLDKLITEALTYIPPREPGSNNYHECRNVLMALHSHYGEEIATNLAESWSPSIPDTTWDIPYKMSTFKRDGIGIGTLFYIAKSYGWECPEDLIDENEMKLIKAEFERFLRDKKVDILGQALDLLDKHGLPEYSNYDVNSWGEDLENSLEIVAGDLSNLIKNNSLNGHTPKVLKILTEYKNLTENVEEVISEEEVEHKKEKLGKRESKRKSGFLAAEEAKKVIGKNLLGSQELLELEAIRSQYDIASTVWERTVKQILREVYPERLTAKISEYIEETDRSKKIEIRRDTCTRFQINKADFDELVRVSINEKTKSKRPVKFLTLDQTMNLCSTDSSKWIIPNFISQGSSVIVAGLPGAAKTLLCVDLVVSILKKESFLGIDPALEDPRIIFISSDQSLNKSAEYFERRGLDVLSPEYKDRILINGKHKDTAPWTMEHLPLLREQLETFRPHLVVIDSLRTSLIYPLGLDENSSEVGKWINDVNDLCSEFNCSVIFIHHSNKKGVEGVAQASGSTAITGNVDSVITIKKQTEGEHEVKRIIRIEKSRDCEEKTYQCVLDSENLSFSLTEESQYAIEETKTLGEKIIQLLDNHKGIRLEVEEIHNVIGGNLFTIKKTVSNLASAKTVRAERHPTETKRRVYSSIKFEARTAEKSEILHISQDDCPF